MGFVEAHKQSTSRFTEPGLEEVFQPKTNMHEWKNSEANKKNQEANKIQRLQFGRGPSWTNFMFGDDVGNASSEESLL